MATDTLSLAFSALADPTRRAILVRLADGDVPVKELAKPFRMSLPAISRHLKVLERGGLITRGREAQRRPCKLQVEQMQAVEKWLEHHRRHWEESFDRLGEYLKELQAEQKQNTTPTRKKAMTTPAKSNNETEVRTSSHEIVISRVFDAPRELVWEAMTDPKKVVNWWGPRGFTTNIERWMYAPAGCGNM